jgi:DNA modification methylase
VKPQPERPRLIHDSPQGRLFCGDYRDLPIDEQPKLILTSPPSNIGTVGPARHKCRAKGEYDGKSYAGVTSYPDDLPEDVYQAQQLEWFYWAAGAIAPDGVIIYNHKLRRKNGRIIDPAGWFPPQEVLWWIDHVTLDKGSTQNHCKRFTYAQTEDLYVFSKPGANYYFRNQDLFWKERPNGGAANVWPTPRPERQPTHGAVMPLGVARQCIRLWSRCGDLVLDPYMGSGTTAVAAVTEGRRFLGSERMMQHAKAAARRVVTVIREVAHGR